MANNRMKALAKLAVAASIALIAATISPAGADDPPPQCFGRDATIVGTTGNDVIDGTPGSDVIVTLSGSDIVRGHGGDDYICTGRGNDTVYAGPGDDSVELDEDDAPPQDDRAYGGEGEDWLRGRGGVDELRGGVGDDVIIISGAQSKAYGGDGADKFYANTATVFGNAGNDWFELALGTRVYGGSGDDYARMSNTFGSTPNIIHLGSGNDRSWDTSSQNNRVFGGPGNDELHVWLYANGGPRFLNGGTGDDWLRGGRSNDRLNGNQGNDLIEGNQGNDELRGGSGDDVMIGDSYLGQGTDLFFGGPGIDDCSDQGRVRFGGDQSTFTVTMNDDEQVDPFNCENQISPDTVYDAPTT